MRKQRADITSLCRLTRFSATTPTSTTSICPSPVSQTSQPPHRNSSWVATVPLSRRSVYVDSSAPPTHNTQAYSAHRSPVYRPSPVPARSIWAPFSSQSSTRKTPSASPTSLTQHGQTTSRSSPTSVSSTRHTPTSPRRPRASTSMA